MTHHPPAGDHHAARPVHEAPKAKVVLTVDGMLDNEKFRKFLLDQKDSDQFTGENQDEEKIKKMYEIFGARKEAAKSLAQIAKESLKGEFNAPTDNVDKVDFVGAIEAYLDRQIAEADTDEEKMAVAKTILGEVQRSATLSKRVGEAEQAVARELGTTSIDQLREKHALLKKSAGDAGNVVFDYLRMDKAGRIESSMVRTARKELASKFQIEADAIAYQLERVSKQVAKADQLEAERRKLEEIKGRLALQAEAGGAFRSALIQAREQRFNDLVPVSAPKEAKAYTDAEKVEIERTRAESDAKLVTVDTARQEMEEDFEQREDKSFKDKRDQQKIASAAEHHKRFVEAGTLAGKDDYELQAAAEPFVKAMAKEINQKIEVLIAKENKNAAHQALLKGLQEVSKTSGKAKELVLSVIAEKINTSGDKPDLKLRLQRCRIALSK